MPITSVMLRTSWCMRVWFILFPPDFNCKMTGNFAPATHRSINKTTAKNFLHIIVLLHPARRRREGVQKVKLKQLQIMFWPHTKTLVPEDPGYELSVEMWKPPLANLKIAVTTNSVPCITTPPLFRKPKSAENHLCRHDLQQSYLYQITHFPVNENLWIMSGYLFLMWLCLRLLTDHLNGELWNLSNQFHQLNRGALSRVQMPLKWPHFREL